MLILAKNTFPLPEIIYDESLIFSPHVFIFGVLFRDKAFVVYNLTSKEELSQLYIELGRNKLLLRLYRELNNIIVLQ